jgi:hypothetical protein
MKRLKVARYMFWGLLIFFVTYNTYYGWNTQPINETEAALDSIFKLWFYVHLIIYFLPLLDLYENAVKKHLN